MSGAASHDGGWARTTAPLRRQHDNGELYAWGGGGGPTGAPRMGAWAAGAASPSASGSALSGGRHDDDDDDEYSNSPHRMGPGGDGGAGRYGPPGGEVSRSARRRRQRAKAEARTQELKQLFVDGEGLSHGTAPYNALLSALANGWYDVARDLIRMSLPLGGLKGDGLAPAVAALSSGNASVVEVLFEHGVSPLVRDASGSTLLHIAVKQVARLCVERRRAARRRRRGRRATSAACKRCVRRRSRGACRARR